MNNDLKEAREALGFAPGGIAKAVGLVIAHLESLTPAATPGPFPQGAHFPAGTIECRSELGEPERWFLDGAELVPESRAKAAEEKLRSAEAAEADWKRIYDNDEVVTSCVGLMREELKKAETERDDERRLREEHQEQCQRNVASLRSQLATAVRERDEALAAVTDLAKREEATCAALYNTGATRGDSTTRAKRAVESYQELLGDAALADEWRPVVEAARAWQVVWSKAETTSTGELQQAELQLLHALTAQPEGEKAEHVAAASGSCPGWKNRPAWKCLLAPGHSGDCRFADEAQPEGEAKPKGDEMRTCMYCGCNTNAKVRRCCDEGHNADREAPEPPREAELSPEHESKDSPALLTALIHLNECRDGDRIKCDLNDYYAGLLADHIYRIRHLLTAERDAHEKTRRENATYRDKLMLHQSGCCTCGGEGACQWCRMMAVWERCDEAVELADSLRSELSVAQARVVELERLRDGILSLTPGWDGDGVSHILEQVCFWLEDSRLFHDVRVLLADPMCLSSEVMSRVRDMRRRIAELEKREAPEDAWNRCAGFFMSTAGERWLQEHQCNRLWPLYRYDVPLTAASGAKEGA